MSHISNIYKYQASYELQNVNTNYLQKLYKYIDWSCNR